MVGLFLSKHVITGDEDLLINNELLPKRHPPPLRALAAGRLGYVRSRRDAT